MLFLLWSFVVTLIKKTNKQAKQKQRGISMYFWPQLLKRWIAHPGEKLFKIFKGPWRSAQASFEDLIKIHKDLNTGCSKGGSTLSTGWIIIQRISVRETSCAIQCIVIYQVDSVRHHQGPVHFYICFVWINRYLFFRFVLPSTRMYLVKTLTENASFQKRSPEWRVLKKPASRLRVDGRKRRFSNTMMSYIMFF